MCIEENVFLFVPNLIGYVRIALALLSFYFMPSRPVRPVLCYVFSGLLDALDGYAARALNQSTRFGAMLDMLTDRCATMCLLVNLALLYPAYAFLFQLSMCLDVAGHWLHLQSAAVRGSASHKAVDLSSNAALRLYYMSGPVLFVICAGNELFFVLLYVLRHVEEPAAAWLYWLRDACGVVCLLKSAVSLLHLITAARSMAAWDAAERRRYDYSRPADDQDDRREL